MLSEMNSKTCRVCLVEKPIEAFQKRSDRPSTKTECRDCVRAWFAEYRKRNRESLNAYDANYRVKNSAVIAAKRKQARAESPHKNVEHCSAWRAKNPEAMRESAADWKRRNPEARRAHWRNRNAKKRSASGTHGPADITRLFNMQRGLCAVCKASIADGWHVDHINPLALGGSNSRENLQLLCATCNCKKGAKPPEEFMRTQGFLL